MNVKCNLCLSAENVIIKEGVYESPSQNIYKCKSCGHYFLAPFLSDAQEEQFYVNEYPVYLLKRGDFKSQEPQLHFDKNKVEAERRYKDIKKILSKKKDILEIGSASGFFLDYIRKYSKSVCGVEPSAAYLNFANVKGIKTLKSFEGLNKKSFDVIFMYYVLEHIKEPENFLRKLREYLKDGNSKFVIEVPNADEALVSLYKSGAYGKFVWQRAHCSYFTVASMTKLLDRLGLKADFVPVQRYDVSNHLFWLAEGKPGGAGKFSHIFSEKLNDEYRANLRKHWICDSILAVVS